MEAVLCDISALEYWRSRSELLGSPDAPRNAVPRRRGRLRVDAPCASIARDLRQWGAVGEGTVHLLVGKQGLKRHLDGVCVHLLSTEVPAGSFVRVAGQVYVVCPELLFVMMAPRLSLIQLLELGHELCGTYRLLSDEEAVYDVRPLTNVSELRAFARKCRGMHGRSAALRALQWIADGSRSPAETALSIVFRLPYRHGGYSLGSPLLNHTISLNEAASRILGRDTITPDLYWPGARHPCEYDSTQFHSTREQAEYDERRRNAYGAMGMGVTVFRPRHVLDGDLMDKMAASVRRNCHMRVHRRPDDYDQRHAALLDEVFRRWRTLRESSTDEAEYVTRSRILDVPVSPW